MSDSDATLSDEVRFWYRGKTSPPVNDVLSLVQASPTATHVFDGSSLKGDYAPLVNGVGEALAALQRLQLPMQADTAAARQQQFLFSLLGLTTDIRERVDLLKQLGRFVFRRSETKQDRQRRLKMAVADCGDQDASAQVKELMTIWRPEPKSFLDALLQRPADAARMLTRRLTTEGAGALQVINHDLTTLSADEKRLFVSTGVVAYQQQGSIHLLGEIGDFLRPIDGGQSGHGLSALQLLLAHGLTQAMLLDSTELDAMAASVVASTFEHCLGGNALLMAVESFFVEWESRHMQAPLDPSDEEDPIEAWQECLVEHDELRPEAFVQRSTQEQQQILREMFGDEWTDDDDAEIADKAAAAA
ncbi:MAG: hypothetical protein HOM68_27060 [Gemmatimonadetes bacterium]|jgi:hypothetical protein|nr:hypothetical protein [Gemmatimonadota bacterium]MBT4609231.1 hypothetical protein [Gemmatimonadota bacterium]MBT5060232.1 hypothetical protein [Gemmatimonadota bacterium]MBT5146422.1 hypothetical protein [Gemmatimonadota bacterium]MBT5591344.1 hypothetical protein [Gemmatimonadota bacterium]